MHILHSQISPAQPFVFVVAGAGGTGMRLIPPLAKLTRPGDAVAIFDPDIFEQRNVLRQHCVEADIGRPKAEVAAERYAKPDVEFSAFHTTLDGRTNPTVIPEGTNVIVCGCVDSGRARAGIRNFIAKLRNDRASVRVAYIDMGNETLVGQVLLELQGWAFKALSAKTGTMSDYLYHLHTTLDAFPQILVDPEAAEDTEGCGVRHDLQTVQANLMAATLGINYVGLLMTQQPIPHAGVVFSTDNAITPIHVKRTNELTHRAYADSTTAIK